MGLALPTAALLAVGLAAGTAFYVSLWLQARLLSRGERLLVRAGLIALRIAIAGGTFWLAAQYGLQPLLASLAGFMLGRLVAGRWAADRS